MNCELSVQIFCCAKRDWCEKSISMATTRQTLEKNVYKAMYTETVMFISFISM